MTATDRIRAAIQRCIGASPAPPTTDDLAAAVLQEAAEVLFPEKPEPIEPIPITATRAIKHAGDWSAWRAMKAAKERLQALAQQLDGTDYGNHVPDSRKMVSPADALAAHAALARPVADGPTDEELLAFVPQGSESDFWLPRGLPSDWVDGDFIAPPGAVVAFARAVLAHYGHQPAPPAEGEVAELVALIRQIALAWEPDACLLGNMTAGQLCRAADLLEQRHPTPVPVSERLPELRGMFERILCVARSSGQRPVGNIQLADRLISAVVSWSALPLPAGEVQP